MRRTRSIGLIGLHVALAVAFLFSTPVFADRDKALEHYNSGISLLEEGKYRDAIEALERAVQEDYRFADAHAKLAAAHFRLNRIEDRRIAVEEYELAIRYDPENPDYYLELGRVQTVQSFDRAAKDSFRKTLELDPGREDAYLELGLLALRRWQQEGEDLDPGYEVLMEARRRGSASRDLLFTLGRIANEMEQYAAAEEALAEILTVYPSDTEANFQYALALQGQGKLEEAEAAYLAAISMAPPEDRAFFLGIQGVASPGLDRRLRDASEYEIAEISRRFWRERDPNPGTAVNERLLEHWRRILQADLRFSVPGAGLQGRATARGQTYIRFGPPTARVTGIDDTQRELRPDEEFGRIRESPLHNYTEDVEWNPRPVEVWTYWIDGKPFELTFRDRFLDGRFDFAYDLGREVAADWEAWIRETPQLYLPEYEGKQIQIVADACSFYRMPGSTRQEVYYAVPAKDLNFQYFGDTWKGRLALDITIYDPDWNVIGKDQMSVVTEVAGTLDNVRKGSLTQQFDYDLPPGRYLVALSLEDRAAELMALATLDFVARPLDPPGLRLSDILLAQSIAATRDPNPFDKEGLTVVPHPSHFFRRSQPVHFYYEVYGLALDQGGQSNFKATVSVVPVDVEEAGGIWQAIRGIFRRKPSVPPFISTSFTYTESAPDSRQRLSLDLSPLRYGKYDLSIRVEDLAGGETASVSTSLWITR